MRRPEARLAIEARATLPTRHGTFDVAVFRWGGDGAEHVALTMGAVDRGAVLVRVHSECLTSEVLGSLRCDCAGQLDAALARIGRAGAGVLVYLRQEGRGIGLASKIRAYALQDGGLDTVDANRALGLPDDARRYDAAAAILDALGVRAITLMTNNPDKARALAALGVDVRRVRPIAVPAGPHSAAYLEAKRLRMGHLLPPTTAAVVTDPAVERAASPP